MNSKVRLIIPLFFVVAFIASSFSKSSPKEPLKTMGTFRSHKFNVIDSNDIIVGIRTTDSTGQMTISSSDIQQSIVATIPPLAGMTLSTSQQALLVTPVTAYLMLSGTSASGEFVKVAIQLLFNGSTITYHTHASTVVHVCKNSAGCSGCKFMVLGNMIINCQCDLQDNDSTSIVCKNKTTWLR